MAKNRLAILPGVTRYALFLAPALVPTVLPFLDGKRNTASRAQQVEGKKQGSNRRVSPRAARPGRQYLITLWRDSHHVFPLGGQGPVFGHDSPAVGQLPGLAFAGVEHGFDGEHHARLESDSFPGPAIVQHLQVSW
jgi:hypothetical protein